MTKRRLTLTEGLWQLHSWQSPAWARPRAVASGKDATLNAPLGTGRFVKAGSACSETVETPLKLSIFAERGHR